jgi:hypothetical protein
VKSTKSNPDPPPDPEHYKEAWKRTYDTIERMELEYDKALLILHPLGISVTSGLLVALWNNSATILPLAYACLYLAWIAWVLGIIATLRSFRISVDLHSRVLDFLRDNKDPTGDDAVETYNRRNRWVTRFSGIAFVFGVSLAAIFLAIVCTNAKT